MKVQITAVIPADATYRKMLAAWEACEAVDAPIPRRILDYFGGSKPDPAGREEAIGTADLDAGTAEWAKVEYGLGLEVSLRALPAGTTALRLLVVEASP